ncbi:hypothetical protein GGX14DRAFT_572752 [Mycena pura]|uniref:Uncharacterized protein n=1 Tax=Mycena pura TaxID=153505 RepID=A0AAD6V442_9AGAR|nr:hypothetical protein GGX14DRAFT_572752 [Mycena pura]
MSVPIRNSASALFARTSLLRHPQPSRRPPAPSLPPPRCLAAPFCHEHGAALLTPRLCPHVWVGGAGAYAGDGHGWAPALSVVYGARSSSSGNVTRAPFFAACALSGSCAARACSSGSALPRAHAVARSMRTPFRVGASPLPHSALMSAPCVQSHSLLLFDPPRVERAQDAHLHPAQGVGAGACDPAPAAFAFFLQCFADFSSSSDAAPTSLFACQCACPFRKAIEGSHGAKSLDVLPQPSRRRMQLAPLARAVVIRWPHHTHRPRGVHEACRDFN